MATFLSGALKPELEKAVSLTLFIPVVFAFAENVCTHSVSLALRVMQGKPPTLESRATGCCGTGGAGFYGYGYTADLLYAGAAAICLVLREPTAEYFPPLGWARWLMYGLL